MPVLFYIVNANYVMQTNHPVPRVTTSEHQSAQYRGVYYGAGDDLQPFPEAPCPTSQPFAIKPNCLLPNTAAVEGFVLSHLLVRPFSWRCMLITAHFFWPVLF
jgi:hypothetical protein